MSDLVPRLREALEPILAQRDPRAQMSAYHNMPYVIFCYPPAQELELRKEVSLLHERLELKDKKVTRISLAKCLTEAMISQNTLAEWVLVEREQGVASVIDTVHNVLSDYTPLVDLVAACMPKAPDPLRDIVFIQRTGALFPMYRTFALPEQLTGRVLAPTVLFYPGTREGAAGLKFMGVLDAEHNYRPKIF